MCVFEWDRCRFGTVNMAMIRAETSTWCLEEHDAHPYREIYSMTPSAITGVHLGFDYECRARWLWTHYCLRPAGRRDSLHFVNRPGLVVEVDNVSPDEKERCVYLSRIGMELLRRLNRSWVCRRTCGDVASVTVQELGARKTAQQESCWQDILKIKHVWPATTEQWWRDWESFPLSDEAT